MKKIWILVENFSDNHWRLVVLFNPSSLFTSSEKKAFYLFDSLSGSSSNSKPTIKFSSKDFVSWMLFHYYVEKTNNKILKMYKIRKKEEAKDEETGEDEESDSSSSDKENQAVKDNNEMSWDNKLDKVESNFDNDYLKWGQFNSYIIKNSASAKSVKRLLQRFSCFKVSNCLKQDNDYDCGLCVVLNSVFICKLSQSVIFYESFFHTYHYTCFLNFSS